MQSTGAGRTDAGVHAAVQVVHADVPQDAPALRDLDRTRAALDKMLGDEIAIRRVRRVPASFDARHSATQRRYRYRIDDGMFADPLRRLDTWHLGPPTLDVAAMHEAGQVLLGEHDFSAFCRRTADQHLVRSIDRLAVKRPSPDLVLVEVDGRAFCHQMVRSITAALVAVGRGKRPTGFVAEALASGDRQSIGGIAPPHGLTLVGVSYSPRPEAAPDATE